MEGRAQRFHELLTRYASGRISREEFDELFDRLCEQEGASHADFAHIWDRAATDASPLGDQAGVFERILADGRFVQRSRVGRKQAVRWYWRLAGAAALVAASLAVGWLLHDAGTVSHGGTETLEVAADRPLAPGSNKAVLEWSGGGKMELEDTEAGIAITDGMISYGDGTALDGSIQDDIRLSAELVLRIPRGGQYRIAMDDGTVIWLNAGSTLRYPAAFAKSSRDVILEGEAFFEIAKDASRPFRVRTGETLIEVLGTRFNVSAYHDDDEWVTTVAEGSVRVAQGGNQVVLVKDQAGVVHANAPGKLSVRKVNAERAMAWTGGLFAFDRDGIAEVMKRIGRWYDAEVVLQGDFSGRTLGGSVSRYESVEELLGVLAMTDQFDYKIEGRRITIME